MMTEAGRFWDNLEEVCEKESVLKVESGDRRSNDCNKVEFDYIASENTVPNNPIEIISSASLEHVVI